MFPAYTTALRDRDLPEDDIRVLSRIIPGLLFNEPLTKMKYT